MGRLFQDREKTGHWDLEATEMLIRRSMHEVGGIFLEKVLNVDGGDHRGTRISCGEGHKAEFSGYRTKKVLTVLSEVNIKRAHYHCFSCKRGVIPKDQELDIEGTSFSPGVRRMMTRVGAKESFEEGRRDLEELAGIRVTAKEVERVSEELGAEVEEFTERERIEILGEKGIPDASSPSIPHFYIAIDGTGVPVVSSEVEGRKGKQTEIAKTRECKLGAIFTQTGVDSKGNPVRDEGVTTYVGAIESVESFGRRIYMETRRRGVNHAEKVILLGDGAAWIRGIAEEYFPNVIQIVDLFHALEHLWDLGKLVYGSSEQSLIRWFERQKKELKEGDVKKVIQEIQRLSGQYPSLKEIEKTLGYFERNQEKMRYAEWIQQKIFVGSGVIEAGCRTLVGQRLKQSGMRWTVKGANAIIALRCCQASRRWEDFWESRAA